MARLTAARWRARASEHAARADELTAAHRERRASGRTDPVEDFLYTYYPTKPGRLRQWHPGAGVVLADAEDRADWRWYLRVPGGLAVDAAGLLAAESTRLGFAEAVLRRSRDRAARLGCFGLHEWAMVYRQHPEQLRHRQLPLRLGHAGTDEVVESHAIVCTHFDAYRFFTDDAVPRNRYRPSRAGQPELEQPGCLHAGMDLYKWALALGPLTPGELLLDAFELAREIRELDMRASPYDLREQGLEPVAIETDAGKAEYARRQRDFADRGQALRDRLIDAIDRARDVANRGAPQLAAHPAG